MITRIGILDGLTPAVAAWAQGLSPSSRRALVGWARLIRKQAVLNIGSQFRRTGRNRTGGGQRGIKIRSEQSAGVQTVRIWHGSGILAAHELGSTIPPVTIRPVTGRVLGWGGPPGEYTRFARFVTRRGFTLRRRATLEPAYQAQLSAGYALLEAEYQKLVDQAPPALRT